MRRDEDDPAPLIDLDVELGEEVRSTEDRHANIAEAWMKLQFPAGDPRLYRGWGQPVNGEAVASVDGYLGAVPKVEAEGDRVFARHDSATSAAVREHRHREKRPRGQFDFRIYGWIQTFALA